MRRSVPRDLALALLLAAAPGCGKDGGASESAASTATATTTSSSDATTGEATAATSAGSGSMSASGSTDAGSTSASSTTGIDVAGFERFRLSTAAGPCPPDADCDGFVELLPGGTLRVEHFGDVSDTVAEVTIPAAAYDAAVQVFADPALVALLDGADPLCDPPTDIFEAMIVELGGVVHDATTTTCGQAPVAAARAKANELQMLYAP